MSMGSLHPAPHHKYNFFENNKWNNNWNNKILMCNEIKVYTYCIIWKEMMGFAEL